ncbi:MAG: cell division protein FtsQ/DivIB [Alphaproteobacteria bacterium]|jgi:cell division protein FtsQ
MRRLIGFWRKDGHVEASSEAHKVNYSDRRFDGGADYARDEEEVPESALEQRRRKLNRESRHRRISGFLRVASPLVLVVAIISAVAWTWYSGRMDIASIRGAQAAQVAGSAVGLRIEEFSISGRRYTRESDIVAAVGAYYGDPILAIDPTDAKLRIEGLPWVERAEVERILPKTISVNVIERIPMAIWQSNDLHHVIDTRGEVIIDQSPSDFLDLPVVSGDGAASAAAELVSVLNIVPSIRQYVVAAERRGDRRWDLFLTLGIKVQLPGDNADLALRRLADAEGRFGLFNRDIVNIDLRVPDRMIVRKRNESEEDGRDLFSTKKHVSTFFQDSSENSLTTDEDSVTL